MGQNLASVHVYSREWLETYSIDMMTISISQKTPIDMMDVGISPVGTIQYSEE
jgi:hypothetical protein